MKQIIKKYNNVAELSATLSQCKPLTCWDDPIYKRSGARNLSFLGATYTDACNMLANGDHKSAAKIRACGDIKYKENSNGRPYINTAVTGCMPCVPNYLRGVPNSMLRLTQRHNDTPVIDMYINVGINASINEERASEVAYNIANTIAATEQAGVRVNLYAVSFVRGSHGEHIEAGIIVKIKDSMAPLNLLNIAFMICNKSFDRVCFMSWMERNIPVELSGYGRAMVSNDIQSKFGINGLFLGIGECCDNGTTQQQMIDKVNEYIKQKEERK